MSSLLPGTVADIWSYVSPADITDNAADAAKAAKTGYRHHIGSVQVSNTKTDTATLVHIQSGSTVIWTGHVAPYIAAAPGAHYITAEFNPPLMCGVGEAVNVICGTTATQTRFCVQGFTTKG